jgi:hypothetical protein
MVDFFKIRRIPAWSKSKQEKARRLLWAPDESHQPAMPTVKPFFGVLDFEKLCVNYGA